MTKVRLRSGVDVYTDLSATELKIYYLNAGNKTGTIAGYTDNTKNVSIIIAVQAIDYIYA